MAKLRELADEFGYWPAAAAPHGRHRHAIVEMAT
jgi:hypothetical protein